MNRISQNGILGIGAISVPPLAEYATAKPGNVPGTGFQFLLYQPFEFAYVILVTLLFLALNIWSSSLAEDGSIIQGAMLGLLCAVGWFVLSFLAVGQLHLSLGGKL